MTEPIEYKELEQFCINPELTCDGLKPKSEDFPKRGRTDWMAYGVICNHDEDVWCDARRNYLFAFLKANFIPKSEIKEAIESKTGLIEMSDFFLRVLGKLKANAFAADLNKEVLTQVILETKDEILLDLKSTLKLNNDNS